MKKGFETKIFIIAGEVSGDIHGSMLLSELHSIKPEMQFVGIGGDLMIKAGLHVLYHIRQMAFLGIGEVIRHLPFILNVLRTVKSYLNHEKPDAVILIDYPGFNLKIAQRAHALGIPVIYYISPQLWAWGQRRVKKIHKYVSKMIVIFPFEVDFYAQFGISATYVGHPLVDIFGDHITTKTRQNQKHTLGLLPGSRVHELEQLLPDMIRTANRLYQQNKINQAIIAKVGHIPDEVYQKYLNGADFIKLQNNSGQEYYEKLSVALVSSGTATLETGFFGVPMVIVYRVNKITWVLGRLMVKLDSIGLVNIVAGEKLCPELLQGEFTPERAVELLSELLNEKKNKMIRDKLRVVKEKLGTRGASRRAAEEIVRYLNL
jgi:lipid-A-disaccharide synthase